MMSETGQSAHHLLPTGSKPYVKTGIPEFKATGWLVDRIDGLVCNTLMMMKFAVLTFSGCFLLYFKSFVVGMFSWPSDPRLPCPLCICPPAHPVRQHVVLLCLYSCSFPPVVCHWIIWMDSSVSLNTASLSTAGFVHLYLALSVLSTWDQLSPDNSKIDYSVWLESNIQ